MNTNQALYVARKVLIELQNDEYDTRSTDPSFERRFEKKWGISHAQVVNALPIIEALEIVEVARYE